MSIGSLSSSKISSTQLASCIYINTSNTFLLYLQSSFCQYIFDKIITTESPKSHNPVQNMYCIQILSFMLVLCSVTFVTLLCSKLCWHNWLKPRHIMTIQCNFEGNLMCCFILRHQFA